MKRRGFLNFTVTGLSALVFFSLKNNLWSDEATDKRYEVDKELCIACGICVNACQQKAITLTEKFAVIDKEKCIGCGKCSEACPREAIYEVSS